MKIIHILAHNIEDFITGDYSNFDNHTIRFMEKIRKFSNNKYEQELWLLSKKDFSATVIHEKGFKIKLFPISIKLPLPLEISFPLIKEIIKTKTDVWHLHSYYLFIYDFIAPILKIKKQKFLMQFHGGGPSYRIKSILYTIYHYLIGLRITLNLSDYVIALNKNEEKRVRKFLWVKNVIYFPSTVPINQCLNRLESNTDKIKMVIAGRMEKINKEFAVPLLNKLLSNNQNLYLEIIGLKKHDQNLQSLVNKYPEQVTLTNWLDKGSLLNTFKQSNLFLHLFNKNEGSPITVIEALSQGLPILAFNVEGVKDAVIPSVTGWLTNNEKEYEKKLLNIIEKPKQLLIKKDCINLIKQSFTDEQYFPKLMEIYKELID